MKIQVQVEIAPGTNAATGVAQHLLEQVAIAVASGGVEGTHKKLSGDGKTVFGEASYTVEPDAKQKEAKAK